MNTKETLREGWNKQKPQDQIGIMQALHDTTCNWWLSKRDSELKDLIKTVEGMKKPVHERDWDQANLDEGFNSALDDIISKIKELL